VPGETPLWHSEIVFDNDEHDEHHLQSTIVTFSMAAQPLTDLSRQRLTRPPGRVVLISVSSARSAIFSRAGSITTALTRPTPPTPFSGQVQGLARPRLPHLMASSG
jgi:hypothetical protein